MYLCSAIYPAHLYKMNFLTRDDHLSNHKSYSYFSHISISRLYAWLTQTLCIIGTDNGVGRRGET